MTETITPDTTNNIYALRTSMNESVKITDIDVKNFIFSYKEYVDRKWVDLNSIYEHIKNTIPEKITMNEFYNYVADYCASKISMHPDYNKLASRICVDRLHKTTKASMTDLSELLYNNTDLSGTRQPLITKHLYNTIKKFNKKIDKALITENDYLFDYFGLRTLERSYLLKMCDENKKKVPVERPQQMIMRVALGIHGNNINDAIETYNLISQRYFTHATPTLFNAGTNRPQLSSCFLLGIDDSLDSILSQIKQTGMISKWAGGIGIHLSGVRGRGSLIRGTNGTSEGIIPLCIVINKLGKYINQGGKRSGSIAIYMEPWHCDIFDFCELRKTNSGNDDNRARDLFLALWLPDLFMKRVEQNGIWSLMCPDECPNLNTTHSDEFEKLYLLYEENKQYKKQVQARDLWRHIVECQIETGFPYMLYKDSANKKSNQQNLGTIRSSNLCAEILEYSDGNTTAVCNLASICLPRFVEQHNGAPMFNYQKLMEVTRIIVRNLNKVIDINFYPSQEAKISNFNTRPVGIGEQGLTNVYNMLSYAYDSEQAELLNKKIHETIYYAALDESKELAKKHGYYPKFKGSPMSFGKLQFHMWDMTVDDLETKRDYDWNKLIDEIKHFGVRNSLLTALMPTASTSQIMKCYESFEPYISNVFVRTTLAGEFIVINENLIEDLIKENLWSDDMRKKLIIANGSVQNIPEIPRQLKNIYKTAFELKLKSIIKQSAERGPFIDQSQSLNLFMDNPDYVKLTSAHFYGWKAGLKTGMYYLRSSSAVNPIQFGIDISEIMRLTGTTNALDLISDGYNIKKTETTSPKKEKPKDATDNMPSCRRGKKGTDLEGCLVCGS